MPLLYPNELAIMIIDNYLILNRDEVMQSVNDLMRLCFKRSNIYYKYNQYEMTLGCMYISLKKWNNDRICNDLLKQVDINCIDELSKREIECIYN
jgi:hypothetical protein